MRRNSMSEPPTEMSDVDLMLLGLTGSGKSSSGNTIIGVRDTFIEDFSPEAVTRVCKSAQIEVDGQTVTVIDTVGLSDISEKITDAQTQIEEMLQGTSDGIDVFLLVIKLGQTFKEENSKVVKWIHDNFGAKFSKHTIVLFTHGDQLQESIEDHLSACEILRSVVGQCSGGFHVFNNKDEDRSQVTELLKKINTLREKNAFERYTEQDYKKTQDDLLLRKCATGVAVGGLGGAAVGVAALAAVGGIGGGGGGAAAVGAAAASGGSAVGAAGASGGGAAVGAAGGAIAAKAGAVALTVGKAALIGAAGGAALAAVAAGAGVYFLARKYIAKEKDKSN